MPQVVIANRLHDGSVVFLAADEKWVERIEESRMGEGPGEAEKMMRSARRAVESQSIVGPELIAVEREGDRIVPKSRRDRIRAQGPSIRSDLGKQAGL